MTIATCPKCQEEVTIPPGAGDQSRVACPLCREEFLLAEVFEDLPPALILLDPPEEAEEAEEPTSAPLISLETDDEGVEATDETEAAEDSDAPDDADTEADVEEDSESLATAEVGAFDFGETAESGDVRTVRSSRRPAKKAENPVLLMVKVIGGGMLAIPLAQLILWWLPGDLSRDPMNLGPKASQYVPWVVPKEYHETSDEGTTAQRNPAVRSVSSHYFPRRLVRNQKDLTSMGTGRTRSFDRSRVVPLRCRAAQHAG